MASRRLRELRGQDAPGIGAEDPPRLEDVQSGVVSLRRAYSTTPPSELQAQVDERLRQVWRLLKDRASPGWHDDLLEAAAWLTLLRGTVLADRRQFEAAQTVVHLARQLASEIGQAEIVGWTWETAAWMAATGGRQCDARELATMGIQLAPPASHGLVAATLQRARINGALGDAHGTLRDLRDGEAALARAGRGSSPDDHYTVDPGKAAFFASGALAALRLPAETIEHAAEVIRQSEDPGTRNYWPMRVANARLEWATALVDQGDEDEGFAMALLALDREWFRPDTERRTRTLLHRMRDVRLKAHLAGELEDRLPGSSQT